MSFQGVSRQDTTDDYCCLFQGCHEKVTHSEVVQYFIFISCFDCLQVRAGFRERQIVVIAFHEMDRDDHLEVCTFKEKNEKAVFCTSLQMLILN